MLYFQKIFNLPKQNSVLWFWKLLIQRVFRTSVADFSIVHISGSKDWASVRVRDINTRSQMLSLRSRGSGFLVCFVTHAITLSLLKEQTIFHLHWKKILEVAETKAFTHIPALKNKMMGRNANSISAH